MSDACYAVAIESLNWSYIWKWEESIQFKTSFWIHLYKRIKTFKNQHVNLSIQFEIGGFVTVPVLI